MAGRVLPQYQGADQTLQLMQSAWSTLLDPILRNPVNSSVIIPNVTLVTGDNVINTRLARKLIGWSIIRKRAAADIYDKQDTNQTPTLTLVLNSSAPCVVDLEIF